MPEIRQKAEFNALRGEYKRLKPVFVAGSGFQAAKNPKKGNKSEGMRAIFNSLLVMMIDGKTYAGLAKRQN